MELTLCWGRGEAENEEVNVYSIQSIVEKKIYIYINFYVDNLYIKNIVCRALQRKIKKEVELMVI